VSEAVSVREDSGTTSADHLTLAFNLATSKPMVFAPALLGAIINFLVSRTSDAIVGPISWSLWQSDPSYWSAYSGPLASAALLGLIGGVIGYILNFASIDMSRDAYVNEPLDLMNSVNYVLRRIMTFILASIVGFLMGITIILIPVATFMFVIIVVDETGIGDAVSKAFSVIGSDLGDVIVVLIVAIIGSIILGLIPFVGSILTRMLNVVIGLAFMDIYYKYKQTR
jgi:hypothetical protein